MTTPNKRGSTLSANTQAVLNTVLAHHPIATAAVVQHHLGTMTAPQVRKTLANLRQQGYLSNVAEHGRDAVWDLGPKAWAMSPVAPATSAAPKLAGQAKSQPKTASRLAVEAALQAAGHHGLNYGQLAEKTQLSVMTVKAVIKAMEAKAKVQRIGLSSATKYVLESELAKAEAAKREARQTPLRNSTTADRNWAPTWLRSHSDRPGANDAFTLPSLVGGVRHAPQKPMSMGTGAGRAAMAIGGGRRFAE